MEKVVFHVVMYRFKDESSKRSIWSCIFIDLTVKTHIAITQVMETHT